MIYEDLKIGQIIPAKEYNSLALAKYSRDCDKYRESGKNSGMPQIAFYGFYSPRTQDHRKSGFVLKVERGSRWFKTKKEAVSYVEKAYA